MAKVRDAVHWDAKYAATDRLWSATPNVTVAEVVEPLPAGRALDVGAGEGRHAVWLAARGWRVTAVDFSPVGIERGRAGAVETGADVDWVVADVLDWAPRPGTVFDLVLVAFIHLPDDVLARARRWLAPGGRLVVVGHDLRNLTDGVGGPKNPALLHTEDEHRRTAEGLAVERLGEVLRETPEGTAIDRVLVARAPEEP
ncbi:MAG: methyltransferase domain-containing protein [Streptosporangiales bacterium]|nr:methyltransferase domain-containing protein [Streptosporangiales bacterium]